MTSTSVLIQQTLTQFTDALAARTATPGGGSMAAFLAAGGVALVSMACRFTSGEKYSAVEPAMVEAAKRLDALRPRALALVDLDSGSYDAVSAAYGMPRATDAEKSARSAAIQKGLKGALEVPFETMQLALDGLELTEPIAARLNPNLASDCGVGARCLATALESAFANVRINAASIKDAAYVSERTTAAELMRARANELLEAILKAVNANS
jgi:formiminotetrahydrofolate cyclodeaminase